MIRNDVGKGAQLELAEHINHQGAMDEVNTAGGIRLCGTGKKLEAAAADEGRGNKSHRDCHGGFEQLSPVHVLYLTNACNLTNTSNATQEPGSGMIEEPIGFDSVLQ